MSVSVYGYGRTQTKNTCMNTVYLKVDFRVRVQVIY